MFLKQQRVPTLNKGILKNSCVLGVLVNRFPPIDQSHKTKSLILIVCNDLGVTPHKFHFLVRVCDGDVENEIVGESMVDFGIIIESTKISTVDVEFGLCVPYIRDKETGVSTNNEE